MSVAVDNWFELVVDDDEHDNGSGLANQYDAVVATRAALTARDIANINLGVVHDALEEVANDEDLLDLEPGSVADAEDALLVLEDEQRRLERRARR